MSEIKTPKWVKASERLPNDENWKAARHSCPAGEYEYSQFAVEGDRFFIGEEEIWVIDDISATILEAWEWLEEVDLSAQIKRKSAQGDGFDDFCEAHQLPYNNECPECADVPDTNVGDIASPKTISKCDNCDQPEEDQPLCDHGESKWCLDCMRLAGHCTLCDADIREKVEDYEEYNNDECPDCANPAPSKEKEEAGIPEEIAEWIADKQWKCHPVNNFDRVGFTNGAIAMYHKLLEDWFNKGPEGY